MFPPQHLCLGSIVEGVFDDTMQDLQTRHKFIIGVKICEVFL